MKLTHTDHSHTTIDVSCAFANNAYGGSPLQIRAIVATSQRGTFSAGRPDAQTRADHAAALSALGWSGLGTTEETTRGLKTTIELLPCDASVGQVSRG